VGAHEPQTTDPRRERPPDTLPRRGCRSPRGNASDRARVDALNPGDRSENVRAHRKKKKRPHAPPRCRRDLALTRQRRPRRVRRFSCLLPPPHRCRRRDVARPIPSCENAPSWGIIGAGRVAPSMPAASAPPAAATAAGAAAAASAVDAARPHPLPTPLPPPLPSLVWAAGGGGDLASSRALLICPTPTRRAAQRACAARAAQSSHARARANVGSSPGQRDEAHTSWLAHTEAEEEGGGCRTERRMPTLRDTCAASAAGSTPLRGSGAAHTYGTPF